MATTKKAPAKKAPVKKVIKAVAPAPVKKTVNPQSCGVGCSVFGFIRGLFAFIIDLIWFVVDLIHAVGFVIAALIAAVALLIASMGVFLHFIGAPESTEFQKLRENMIHMESIRQTPDMMREEFRLMNEIRETEKEISDMRETEVVAE